MSTLTFIPEFASLIEPKFSDQKASFLASVACGAFAVNRLISIFVATLIKTTTMQIISFIMLVTGNLLLLFFANTSEVMLWTSVVIVGAGHANVNPCILSFLEERMNVTTSVCGIFLLSASVTMIAVPIVVGNFIESDPMLYVYLNLGGLFACTLIFTGILAVDRKHRMQTRRTP